MSPPLRARRRIVVLGIAATLAAPAVRSSPVSTQTGSTPGSQSTPGTCATRLTDSSLLRRRTVRSSLQRSTSYPDGASSTVVSDHLGSGDDSTRPRPPVRRLQLARAPHRRAGLLCRFKPARVYCLPLTTKIFDRRRTFRRSRTPDTRILCDRSQLFPDAGVPFHVLELLA